MIRTVHTGKVLDNDDPTKKGGLKVQVDALEDGAPLAGGEFIPPSFPFAGVGVGFFFLPAKGTLVEVEVQSDPEQGTEDLSARWRAVLYTDKDAIPAEFLTDQTNRGGIKFGDGLLLFDSTKDLVALISSNVRLGEEDASHPVMRGDTYNSALDTYLSAEDVEQTAENLHWTAFAAAMSTWSGYADALPITGLQLKVLSTAVKPTTDALVISGGVWKAAILAFKAALTSWLSTKVKTE